MNPLLSVLIATMPHREAKFLALLSVLLPQAEEHGFEVVALRNRAEKSLGDYRQALLNDAWGTYTAFIDDDDTVPGYYAAEICAALKGDPDVVGFAQSCAGRGMVAPLSLISLNYVNPPMEAVAGCYLRSLSHVSPVRTEVARQGRFDAGRFENTGEDMAWARRVTMVLRERGSREAYIGRIMYAYQWDAADSTQFGMRDGYAFRHPASPLPEVSSPAFRWHEWSR